jgi:hypothetical protein
MTRVQEFGRVTISEGSRGRPNVGNYVMDPRDFNRKKLSIMVWGESYRGCCPCCHDTRYRLSVNHAYGVYDALSGSKNYNLWRCYNEDCQRAIENREKLKDLIEDAPINSYQTVGLRRAPPHVFQPPGELPPEEFPGEIVPLTDLPAGHAAVAYLTGRGYDPAALVEVYGVGFVTHVPPRNRMRQAMGRIAVPVARRGVVVGYQFRFPADLDWKQVGFPKYLTYFSKAQAVYNVDRVADAPFVVVMEGVTDVWTYGLPGGVAAFGKKLSWAQAAVLAAEAGDRPIVYMPDRNDPTAWDAAAASAALVQRQGFTGPVGVAVLPDGADPGGLPPAVVRGLAMDAAEAAMKLGGLSC